MNIILTQSEFDELHKQDPHSAGDGGFQSLLVHLQEKTDSATREMSLTASDVERIHRYAFDYKNGGWQNRLLNIFARSLGANLTI